MKWFGVDSDTPNDPKIRALMQQGGRRSNLHAQARMGALFLVWCHIADHGVEPGRGIDANGDPLPLQEIADAAYFDSVEKLEELMDFCATRKHIDPEAWGRGEIFFPAMAKRADEYTKKKLAGKIDARPFGKSGMTRRQIFERDGFRCVWCGDDLTERMAEAEVDHKVPKAQGGTDDPANLATSCRRCNRSRRLQNPPKFTSSEQTAQHGATSSVRTSQVASPESPVCTVGPVGVGSTSSDHPERRHTPRARERGVLDGALQRDHLRHCFQPCGRICYPIQLAEAHARQLGGDPDVALNRIAAFRNEVLASIPDSQVIGDKPFDFWRAHFAAKFPSAAPKPPDARRMASVAGSGRTGAVGAELYDIGSGRDDR